MFGKLKQFVGMVGVNVVLEIEETQLSMSDDTVTGLIRVTAKQEQTITQVKATMKQAIMEGSGQDRSRRDYYIGETIITSTPFVIKPGEEKEFPFSLEFNRRRTMGQQLSEKGGVMGALGTVGKFMDNERDEFWINGMADVKGAALDPNDTKQVWFR
jgi:hypothetical protein